MLRSSIVSLTTAMLLIQGCNQSDPADSLIPGVAPLDLRRPDMVQTAARNSDPLSMLLFATLPIIEHDLPLPEESRTCPRLIDESDRAAGIVSWRIEGDCEWEDYGGQHRVEGSIVAVGDESGTELEYRGYRTMTVSGLESECPGQESVTAMTGVVRLPFAYLPFTPEPEEPDAPRPIGERTSHYELDVHLETSGPGDGCRMEKIDLAYDVTMDRTLAYSAMPYYESDLSDVSGRVALVTQTRASTDEPWQTTASGAWRVTTDGYGAASGDESGEESGDETCWSYITGALRLEAGGDVAVLSPSAPASCLDGDEGQPACTAWSLNGEEQGELCDFVGLSGCSAGPNAPPPWAALVILLGGLLWQQRRARRRRA
jgi:hypothetical protein